MPLPIAIAARIEDIHEWDSWELLYDEVGEVMSRRHHYGENPKWEVRRIRVDQTQDMMDPATIPIDERDRHGYEIKARERRRLVESIADKIIREDPTGVNLGRDFDLEREVLNELWKRWREVTADGFLVRALEQTCKES